jgi:hypothetical protein
MKTVTIEEFLKTRELCCNEEKIRAIAGDKREWSALDVPALDVPAKDRLYAVLDESFIDGHILHEAACRFAERPLARIEDPDPRPVNGIAVKRRWVRGEATDDEMLAARTAARFAACTAARTAAESAWDAAAYTAAYTAMGTAAGTAARAAARFAACTAAGAAAAWDAAEPAEREEQVGMLIELLRESEEGGLTERPGMGDGASRC